MVFSWLQTSWSKVTSLLKTTATSFSSRLRQIFSKPLDDQTKDELEELFYESDLGVPLTKELIAIVEKTYRNTKNLSVDQLLSILKETLIQEFAPLDVTLKKNAHGPTVLLIIGANGHGKTTSIAKLCHMLQKQGSSVLVAACDTFRAAAQEQLELWTKHIGCDIVRGKYQQDPASVAFDAIVAAQARSIEYVIIDTAGRLENKVNLLKELEKIIRICNKALPGTPHETLLVLDATIGQNGISQAKAFHAATPLTGLILTKLDGSAKGGIVLSIQKELKVPAKFIGTGESSEDFAPFCSEHFISVLLDLEEGKKL